MLTTIDTAGLSRDQPLMPGAFGPEDYIDFYDNPRAIVEKPESTCEKRKPGVSWSINNLPSVDVDGLDWHKHDPPKALRKAPNITSQVLLDILQSSLENVQARNIEQDRQKEELEEQRKIEESDKGKSKEPYLPVIIPADDHVIKNEIRYLNDDTAQISPKAQPKMILMTTFGPSAVTKTDAKANKKRLSALRRFFQRSNEKGESSATGAALGVLREETGDIEHGFGPNVAKHFDILNNFSECVSCLDDFHPKDIVKVPCHSYCHDCFIRLVSAACQNEQQWPPKCCLNKISFKIIIRFIPSDLRKTFEERSKEWELPVSDRVYCGDPNCSLWIKPRYIDPSRRQALCDRSHLTCTLCRGPAHVGQDCPQDVDMNLTNQLAEDEGWKRCGTQFCYVCSRRWRTCTCTMENLQEVKDSAASRREERRINDLAEAEELRQALLQIEEFEREEALKAELLRQEQERLEEERRQRELEERVRQESIRRRDIEIKYQELGIMLDQLHELQQVLLEVDQEKEAETTMIDIKTAMDDLEKKHQVERSELETLISVKMIEKEQALNKDFQIRAAEENALEEAYHERLEAYWKGKENGEQEMEASMLALRMSMDKKHHAWQKWKAEQLIIFRSKLEDNRTYREELMYSATHRLDDSCKEKKIEMMRRMAAERKWLQVVILEREKLMSEWEVEEVEGDADSIFAPGSDDSADSHCVLSVNP
ncbi:e3 ubiquitin ligase ARI9 [Fusarium heterosporum]|uniref:E3 ubiquitin ligase ARI9 n=1 Tax=Fusarium heterosporum TaxID=42747 RepID=A0A8H5SZC6_FUSHE|nr:e3 ubiquitin ligase ARI9 [Fusarium heterosporum]